MTNGRSQRHWQEIHEIINNASRIVLSTHVNPDGDGLGSQAAAYHFLINRGKECRILNPSSLPDEYTFLGENTKFELYENLIHCSWVMDADLAIIFDIGHYKRLGKLGEDLKLSNTPTISIDHHPHTNPNGFTKYIHDTSASAAGSLLYDYFKYVSELSGNGMLLTPEIAQGLYTALMTDTGSFRFDNTTAEAHEMARDLLRYGVKPSEIYQKVYESGSIERIRLLALALDTIQLDCNGKLAWFIVTEEMMTATNAAQSDNSGFIDYIRSVKSVEVVLMINEINSERCRVSYRSKGKIRIGQLARQFGGGGHDFAAGATIELPLDQAVEYVVSNTIKVIKDQINVLKE